MQVISPTISEVFSCESLGIQCETPRYGECKCGRCPLGGKDYSLKIERELILIKKGLSVKMTYGQQIILGRMIQTIAVLHLQL